MKKPFLYFFFFSFLFSFSQTKHFDLQWNISEYSKMKELHKGRFALFNPASFQYKKDNVYFNALWKIPSPIVASSIEIINVSYSPIPEQLVQKLSFNRLPDNFKAKTDTYYSRDEIFAGISINAIIRKSGRYYKLDGFDVQYRTGGAMRRSQVTGIYDSKWASGKWYKFTIGKSGIYKIDKNFLKSLGINVGNIDPRKIKIMGNGGKVMPLKNSVPYPEDISELAIEVVGEQDGSFDDNDYILFYGQSHKEWSDEYDSNLNVYTEKTVYFIQIDNQNGKRIQAYQEPAGTPVDIYDEYYARQFYEKDRTSFTHIGRKAFDKPLTLSDNIKDISFTFDRMVLSKPVKYIVKAAVNKANVNLQIQLNGQFDGQINYLTIPAYSLGTDGSYFNTLNLNDNHLNFKLIFNTNNIFDARLYLEYLNVWAYCRLEGNGKQFRFSHPDADVGNGVAAYELSAASNISQIWDITDIYNPTYISNQQNNVQIKFLKETHKRFIAIDPSDYYSPGKDENSLQDNQNLHKELFYHTGSFRDLDYLIVTPEFLHQKAEKFADYHRQLGLNVFVADLQQIYNEFGNGQQDIAAIRNMIKYIYFNASTPAARLKYVMLFGDASNDFKNLVPDNVLTNGENSNIVPIYESLESFSKTSSMASDDFFVLIDQNEGQLLSNEMPDIAVGRLVVNNEADADIIYEKYVHYNSGYSKGNWRSYITLWSDDADRGKPGEEDFVQNTEDIALSIKAVHPEINIVKIYQDAYRQVSTPGGDRYPAAKRDLFNQIEKGTLILSYIGHGNEVALSHERMLVYNDIDKFHNIDRLPLMTTMTCEFARFDNPTRLTAAETLIKKPDGGVLEMVSTLREIYFTTATSMNTYFYDALFGLTSTLNGNIIRNPAEALRVAKNTSFSYKFNIVFMGDPGFELPIGKPKIVLTSVNNQANDTLKALKHIVIKGEVQDAAGNLMTGYNGFVNPTVFDKYIQTELLDNDNNDIEMQFEKLGPKIFQGKAAVTNGLFSFDFIVPKDIKLSYGKGRISFYADNGQDEKIGYNEDIIVGGVDENAEEDNKPPNIKVYMNDTNFVSGGITDSSPYLLLELEDEHGINTIGGIGHDISAYLDDDQTNLYILNDFYETESNTYKKGKVKYRIFDLEPGWHTLTVKAWDVYNNSASATISFQVVKDQDIQIDKVLNYPNPFVNYTEFWFQHNHPYETLDVMIQVYTISGKLVWQHRQNVVSDGFLSREISWDGRDNFGHKLAKGVYVYKLSVRTENGKTAQKIEKLVIL
jgi:hypothetical protein